MHVVWGTVVSVAGLREGIQELRVVIPPSQTERRAVVFTELVDACEPGDEVLLNVTASDLSLGTGGTDFVIAHDKDRTRPDSMPSENPGHIMKLRYTPLQLNVLSVEAQESPDHEAMAHATSLHGTPVVCCFLHSQVPLVAATIKTLCPDARVAYCMTDGAALPISFSKLVYQSVKSGFIDATFTCGQSFGGDHEAINLYSGMLAAVCVEKADVIIVAIGPGVVGSGTPFGHGGVAVGEAINAGSALEGTPIVALRTSFADRRPRHQGVSHHALTALTKVAFAPAYVPIVSLADLEKNNKIEDDLASAGVWELHWRMFVEEIPAINLERMSVTTMGRNEFEDPAFFDFTYASGVVASTMLSRA